MSDKTDIEEGLTFAPKFGADGLIPCITTSANTGKPVMFAYMNEEAFKKSIETGEAHYWSRSRGKLWHKGATSGHIQKIVEMRTDCDQDCIWISVDTGPACHTGREGCFYRKVNLKTGSLEFIDEDQQFDPDDVYS